MKTTLILLPLILGTLASCGSPTKNRELQGRSSMWTGDAIRNASMNQAIVAQHTLYPYHFATGSAELNDIGERDLSVLAAHFQKTPGDLNVRRGDASQTLYETRVKAVLDFLAATGVKEGSIAVKDGPAGGEGMLSERVIVILKEKMSVQNYGSSDTSGTIGGGLGIVQ
jgi:hypothetical protein